jgi:hypothetical protein
LDEQDGQLDATEIAFGACARAPQADAKMTPAEREAEFKRLQMQLRGAKDE